KEDGLQFLSLEEKECIIFFEETIDSLQEGLEEDCTSGRATAKENLRTSASSAPHRAPNTAISPSLMEHDIIDLVHSPHHFNMPVTDFQSQAHFEQKPVRDTVDYPSSAISASSTAPVASDENNHQPPPGSIPTPVLIASRLAEHKGAGSPSTHPNILIQRTRSLEAQHSSSPKCGPPTHAKPARLPDNISMRSSCNPSPQSIAAAAVSLQERRSQMLANLPSNAHPLEGGEPTCIRNMPTRSVSFTDPMLNTSRIEALSKLGLAGVAPAATGLAVGSSGSSFSSGINKVGCCTDTAKSSTHTSITHNSHSPDTSASLKNSSVTSTHSGPSSSHEQKPKSDIGASNFNIYGGKSAIITAVDPPAKGNHDTKSSAPVPPVSAEVTHRDFNSYGGKTIMLNPKSESISSYSAVSSPLAKQVSAEILLNNYGGRSKVITPSIAHTDHSLTSTITARPNCGNLDSLTGSRSSIFSPIKAEGQSLMNSHEAKPSHPDQVSQPIVRAKPATVPSSPAPRPPRLTPSPSIQKPPMPPEVLSMVGPKPCLRAQGVT
ncbi:hypothetical protein P4O66_015516, partial [Electrophorus voltai]